MGETEQDVVEQTGARREGGAQTIGGMWGNEFNVGITVFSVEESEQRVGGEEGGCGICRVNRLMRGR